jgi:Trypsin-co-occurring domain 2
MTKIATVSDLVGELKTAIQQVQGALEANGLRIAEAELKLKVAAVSSGSVGFSFDIVPIELSAKYERSGTQTITLSLVPKPADVELFASVAEELKSAIVAISNAVGKATASPPIFDLQKAEVELEVAVTKEGGVKLFVGGSGSGENAHSMKLTLARA